MGWREDAKVDAVLSSLRWNSVGLQPRLFYRTSITPFLLEPHLPPFGMWDHLNIFWFLIVVA